MAPLHLARAGHGPRIVLVHGGVAAGWEAWDAQRPLADRFELLVLWRSGYAPNPPLDELDPEVQAGEVAQLLRPGDHLVGHSSGALVALLAAAAAAPILASLTVIEPPAFALTAGDPDVAEFEGAVRTALAEAGDPLGSFRAFLVLMGVPADELPDELPPALEDRVRTFLHERFPGDVPVDLAPISGAGLPVLVVSGGWHPAFEAMSDAVATAVAAERLVLPGYGHSVPELGEPFNTALAAFIDRVEASIASSVQAVAGEAGIEEIAAITESPDGTGPLEDADEPDAR